MLDVILYVVCSYLLGAIPFSIIVGYLFTGTDVRKHGSGNAGATNVYRLAGPVAAVLASLLDIAKGAIPVLVVGVMQPGNQWLQIGCGLAAVLGHVFPIYVRFRGGKGVNTLLGVFIILLPLETGICFVIFALVFGLTRIVSLGSIIAGVSLSLIVVIEKYTIGKNVSTLLLSTCLVVTLLVLFTHRANIIRIVKGREKKLSR
jgi:glycerol-3-phosphate acyltransferase PlsY